jgi:hypothetical protein
MITSLPMIQLKSYAINSAFYWLIVIGLLSILQVIVQGKIGVYSLIFMGLSEGFA